MVRFVLALGVAAWCVGARRLEEIDFDMLDAEAEAGAFTSFAQIKLTQVGDEEAKQVLHNVSTTMGCDHPTRVFRDVGAKEKQHRKDELHLWYELRCADEKLDGADAARITARAIKTLATLGSEIGVASASPSYAVKFSYATNDPLRSSQTHYDAIGLAGAWELSGGSDSIVVQVLDTGLDLAHPEFASLLNVWTNPDETCANGLDDDGNGYSDDCHGYNHADNTGTSLLGAGSHGTHCAGTIAAENDNGLFVSGIAGGKGSAAGAQLMVSLGFGATTTAGFAEALVYGADNGAKISSNSWGYTTAGVYDQSVLDAIDYAVARGVIVVFAAGNDGTDEQHYPAYYSGAVAVAATTDAAARASFSNFGDWIDVAAPGVDVLSTVTVADGYTSRYSGTSMATPHVAGLLALGWGTSPDSTRADVLECLYETASDLDAGNAGYEGKLGAGLINAPKFVACVQNGGPTPSPTLTRGPTPAPIFAPTSAPTTSAGPTVHGYGACDLNATLTIRTDNYPSETTWRLDMVSPEGCRHDATTSGGPFSSANLVYATTIEHICAGSSYTFTIYDSYGDGVCCAYGEGYYELEHAGSDVASGGEFGFSESTTFVALSEPSATPTPTKTPTAKPTLHPTAPPTKTPTPRPTSRPAPAPTPAPIPSPTLAPTQSPTPSLRGSSSPTSTASPTSVPGGDEVPSWAVFFQNQILAKLSAIQSSFDALQFSALSPTLAPTPSPTTTLAPTTTPLSAKSCAVLGWNPSTQGCEDVCGGVHESCRGAVSQGEANDYCRSGGSRLCTSAELEDKMTMNVGCNSYNKKYLWTSTSCGDDDEEFITYFGNGARAAKCDRTVQRNRFVRCCADVY